MLAITEHWVMIEADGPCLESLPLPIWQPQHERRPKRNTVRQVAMQEQQDEQVSGILHKIDLAQIDLPTSLVTPSILWQEINTLSEQIPWGHLALDLFATSKLISTMDHLQLFFGIKEADEATLSQQWLLAMPHLLAALLRPLGTEPPDFWDSELEHLYPMFHDPKIWEFWWLDALRSARNKTETGAYDEYTPCPVYAMFTKHRDAVVLSRVILPLPMPILYQLVSRWGENLDLLAVDGFCPSTTRQDSD